LDVLEVTSEQCQQQMVEKSNNPLVDFGWDI
jgi:hypothetical protein